MSTYQLPRFMLAAPASGSGKTMITCGLLKVFRNRMLKTIAYKCGPDYIDPMFHTRITGIPCRNLDTYFASRNTIFYLMKQSSAGMDLAVMEGVMGYFDGVAGVTSMASSYDLANQTDTPVILIVNAKGMSLSIIPYIKGFLEYEERKHIKGVILNRISPMMYTRLKEKIEEELPVKVLGYCAEQKEGFAGSRYLGLQMPHEIEDLQQKVENLAEQLEKTVDIDALLQIARSASQISCQDIPVKPLKEKIRIGYARDEAFCFYYQDNLEVLERLGAECVPFSPLHDKKLPDNLHGLLLGGGYPELFARQLSENQFMKEDILQHLLRGLPYLAECGGFLYLLETMQDAEQKTYPMVGFLPGKVYPTGRLSRFGYISLEANSENDFLPSDETIRAHEFHYYDTNHNGEDFTAKKPQSDRSWKCMHVDAQGIAGFPHLYYYSNLEFVHRFLEKCLAAERS